MREQAMKPSINNHLGYIVLVDAKSKIIISTLEKFKLSLQKMIDISSFENEWIQLIGLVYDQIDNIKKKQVEFGWDIDNRLKEEWIYFAWENKDGIENWIELSQEDKELIKSWTTKNNNRIDTIVSKMDEIFERLLRLKSNSFNTEEYEKVKKELLQLIFWDDKIFIKWFVNTWEYKAKKIFLDNIESLLWFERELISLYKWKTIKDTEKPRLLESIIDLLDDKFKIENVDMIMDYYKKNNDLIAYLQELNLSKKQEEVKDTNLSEQIQSLMSEIATLITQKLPEIEILITQKTQWKI